MLYQKQTILSEDLVQIPLLGIYFSFVCDDFVQERYKMILEKHSKTAINFVITGKLWLQSKLNCDFNCVTQHQTYFVLPLAGRRVLRTKVCFILYKDPLVKVFFCTALNIRNDD